MDTYKLIHPNGDTVVVDDNTDQQPWLEQGFIKEGTVPDPKPKRTRKPPKPPKKAA